MHIASITWARNEEDILESFVRHHSRIVDQMIIVLHRSTDRSLHILRSLQREGLALEIRESDALYHAQGEVLTELMHEVASIYNPDWILPLDADEFLCSSIDFSNALRATPSDTVSLLPWKTYIPTPEDDQLESDIRLRMTHRRAEEQKQYYKVLIPGALALQATLPLGSHQLFYTDTQMPMPSTPHTDVWLAHFPVRSEQQLRSKIINGWEAYSHNPNKKPGQNFHWEQLYDRCKNPEKIDIAELHAIALQYALNPGDIPSPYILDPVSQCCSMT